MGILKDKTIFYVTHQVEFLPTADLILVSKKHILTIEISEEKVGQAWRNLMSL